jgi:CBS domain-containing protein
MAMIVKEIMNRELFRLRPSDPVGEALSGILELGITSAPVVDAEAHPLGVVSLRDLVGVDPSRRAVDLMSTPAAVVREDSSIAHAAELIAQTSYRHLVAVDDRGRAVGMVSAVDVVRGLIGQPARHPAAFPHLDTRDGLTWTDDRPLADETVDLAPDGPGLLVLVQGGVSLPERVVWVGSCGNVRARLIDLLTLPQDDLELTHWLEHRDHLRFRASAVADATERETLAVGLRNRARKEASPGAPRTHGARR